VKIARRRGESQSDKRAMLRPAVHPTGPAPAGDGTGVLLVFRKVHGLQAPRPEPH